MMRPDHFAFLHMIVTTVLGLWAVQIIVKAIRAAQ